MTYNYANITNEPNLTQIHLDVGSSSMTDKTIEWCSWEQDTSDLKICFTNTLDAADKTELDTIISNNS